MIAVTTSISGSRRDEYLGNFKTYAETRGKQVKIYHVGDMLFEHAEQIGVKMNRKNVLNTNKQTLNAIRSAVFERIVSEIPDLVVQGFSIVVDNHASFYWKYRYELAFDHNYLRRLNPDLFINFVDDADSVVAALKAREQWQEFLFEGKGDDDRYALERILEWQSVEVEWTKGLAQLDLKRFFVVPAQASESIMYRLMFEPWRKVFYFGMPLTLLHGDEYTDARRRIDDLGLWLERSVIVMDPRFIEPLTPEHLSKINPVVYHQVVARDLYWLIPQCDGMVAFFPEVAFSAGVNNEMREVHETNGDTFLIYPEGKAISPFLTEWSDKVFRHEEKFKESFMRYLGPEYTQKVADAEKI